MTRNIFGKSPFLFKRQQGFVILFVLIFGHFSFAGFGAPAEFLRSPVQAVHGRQGIQEDAHAAEVRPVAQTRKAEAGTVQGERPPPSSPALGAGRQQPGFGSGHGPGVQGEQGKNKCFFGGM
jgi:hypothetical protein